MAYKHKKPTMVTHHLITAVMSQYFIHICRELRSPQQTGAASFVCLLRTAGGIIINL